MASRQDKGIATTHRPCSLGAGLFRLISAASMSLVGCVTSAFGAEDVQSATMAEPAAPLYAPSTDPYRLRVPGPAQFRLQSGEPDARPRVETSALSVISDRPFHSEVARAAQEFGVDPALIHAVITVESGYNARALSPKGAQGLMQLMPDTAQRFGIGVPNLVWRPDRNIRAGVAYLSALLTLFNQDVALALAAYNAGENAVLRFGGRIPPFRETQDYVPKVLEVYGQLKPQIVPPPVEGALTAKVRRQYPAPRSIEDLNSVIVSD